jgi:hypothetical protein
MLSFVLLPFRLAAPFFRPHSQLVSLRLFLLQVRLQTLNCERLRFPFLELLLPTLDLVSRSPTRNSAHLPFLLVVRLPTPNFAPLRFKYKVLSAERQFRSVARSFKPLNRSALRHRLL